MLHSIRARLLIATVAGAVLVVGASWAYAENVALDAATRSAMRDVLIFASVLAAITAVVLAEVIARRFVTPIAELRHASDALARGDFSVRVRSRRDDEIGGIGRAIDRMADQLADRLEAVRAEESRLRVMLDAMDEAVLVTDPDGLVVLSNAAFVGLSGGAGLGRACVEAIRSAELHEAVSKALRGERHKAVFRLDVKIISAHVAPLPENAGAIVVMRDVTEVRRLDAVRRDFVANASHELRTPLTAIRGFAETLRDGALDEPRIAKRFVGNIVENAIRLQRIVDDLLELSRSESPDARFELEPIDPLAIASKVLSSLEQKASDKGVQLGIEATHDAVPVRGDERALDQVLLNLVDNGIKYTPSGGRVVVRFRKEADTARVEVVDTGPGIAASHLSRIFERFYRVDQGRSREQGGTGLGLAIVKHLTQRMGGEVSVESRLGHGTTFSVRLARAELGRDSSTSGEESVALDA
ncbi:HAMP domain-containing sensor histidine kinase [Sandaracinus amylolyticus]|uniref:HAMP domain-containing sensor histidine kinase n=1 Tax=Sandaracinus amylolyticus TaxID=927083 RepID=UPI001F3363DD|nr:HAMP domain-containing sensor histidine kinase [Sandaracinus amylolyticus]